MRQFVDRLAGIGERLIQDWQGLFHGLGDGQFRVDDVRDDQCKGRR